MIGISSFYEIETLIRKIKAQIDLIKEIYNSASVTTANNMKALEKVSGMMKTLVHLRRAVILGYSTAVFIMISLTVEKVFHFIDVIFLAFFICITNISLSIVVIKSSKVRLEQKTVPLSSVPNSG